MDAIKSSYIKDGIKPRVSYMSFDLNSVDMETLAGNLKVHLHRKKKTMWFPLHKIIVKQVQFYYSDVCHPVLQRELYTRSFKELTQKRTLELYQRVVLTVYVPHIVITEPMSDLCLQCPKKTVARLLKTTLS